MLKIEQWRTWRNLFFAVLFLVLARESVIFRTSARKKQAENRVRGVGEKNQSSHENSFFSRVPVFAAENFHRVNE